MPEQRTYMVIDMKCFYASVECAERQLNPFETCLVVADETRGPNALCLAISPRMKALGIKNRCRLSDIPKNVKYIIAPPRMQLYIDYAADIYAIYLNYFAPDDIHVYSIDESFLDVTHYLGTYHMTPKQLAKQLMNEIADKLRIPSTAGIGTNLYLAKIALDITAKKAKDHMGYLDEDLYRKTLWDHEPLTDFWQVSTGTVNRLAQFGISTMRGITQAPEQLMYKTFGKNAELLIDHAWGRESCEMKDIKNYRAKTHSVSFSQILPRDYSYEEARIVMQEIHMKRIIPILMTLLLLSGCATQSAEKTYRQITMEEAITMMEEETGYIILDVRTAQEYSEKHIPGAINIANESIGTEDISELPDKDQLILVYCRSGNRSKQASEKLVKLGYTNIIEIGGINSWPGETVTGDK